MSACNHAARSIPGVPPGASLYSHWLLLAQKLEDAAAALACHPPECQLQTLIQDIISEGQDTARRMRHQGMAVPNPCLMYKWHGKAYLGAAHGVVGVLHVRNILLIPPADGSCWFPFVCEARCCRSSRRLLHVQPAIVIWQLT